MSYIKKLQSKSESTRKQILVVSMVFSMLIVATVWAYSLGDLFFKDKSEQQVATSDDTKPFKLFANSISDAYQNISASVGNIGNKNKPEEVKVLPIIPKEIDLIPVEYSNN